MVDGDQYRELPENEVDLFDLLLHLKANLRSMIAVFFLVFLCFVVYLLLAPRLYRAEAVFLPPTVKDVQSLNIVSSIETTQPFKRYLPEEVYKQFLTNLESRKIRWEYYQEQNLAEQLLDDDQ